MDWYDNDEFYYRIETVKDVPVGSIAWLAEDLERWSIEESLPDRLACSDITGKRPALVVEHDIRGSVWIFTVCSLS